MANVLLVLELVLVGFGLPLAYRFLRVFLEPLPPKLLFSFPRQQLRLWALGMLLYPALSVYPQGVIYRAFFLHRYAGLDAGAGLGERAQNLGLILISALAFGFLHIIFRNPLAVSLTLAGGLLFAWPYQVTNSLLVSSFEHALYGCLLFTLGLGHFYVGPVRLQ